MLSSNVALKGAFQFLFSSVISLCFLFLSVCLVLSWDRVLCSCDERDRLLAVVWLSAWQLAQLFIFLFISGTLIFGPLAHRQAQICEKGERHMERCVDWRFTTMFLGSCWIWYIWTWLYIYMYCICVGTQWHSQTPAGQMTQETQAHPLILIKRQLITCQVNVRLFLLLFPSEQYSQSRPRSNNAKWCV